MKKRKSEKKSWFKPATKRYIWVGVVILILGLVFAYHFFVEAILAKVMKNFKFPPATISTSISKTASVQPTLHAVGTAYATNAVDVSGQAGGEITHVLFKSGQVVKKGQPLVQLDTQADYQDLANFKAALVQARLAFHRQKLLLKSHMIAKSAFDAARATYRQAQANVRKQQTMIAYKTISAPFAGRLGINNLQTGQVVQAGAGLVNLQALGQMKVLFNVPQQDLARLKVGQTVMVKNAQASLSGKIVAFGGAVNDNTRNIQIEARVSNPGNKMFPGSFVYITVNVGHLLHKVVVPQTAVTYSLYGDMVYTLKPTNKKNKAGKPIFLAQQNIVTPGVQQGMNVVIDKGIKANQTVVTAGQLKLYPNAPVVVNNKISLAYPVSGQQNT